MLIKPITLAVIDLGSNTFHLMIVKLWDKNRFEVLYRAREFTRLSEGGVEQISEESFNYGLLTLEKFATTIKQYPDSFSIVVGTAVLRNASNSNKFVQKANQILNTEIEIIQGDREATLIYKGMMWFPTLKIGCHLIMDIGGGSTEFIIVNEGIKQWSESYPLGVGHLFHSYHKHDPIDKNEITLVTEYIEGTALGLKEAILMYRPTTLVGASGSFEVLESMNGFSSEPDNLNTISIDSFLKLYESIIHSTIEERLKMEGLPKERVQLIVVAMILKRFIVTLYNPSEIIISPFALKEGIIKEFVEQNAWL